MARLDLIGKKFGKLFIISYFGIRGRYTHWNARCDCGHQAVVAGRNLQNGHTKSCGCLQKIVTIKNQTTHGKSYTLLYKTWQAMKDRCLNPANVKYKNYGGRGITICNKWLKFEGFYEDMRGRPKGMTIERVDNNKGYNKENCKWATKKEQANNMRSNKILTYRGISLTMSQWAERLEMSREKLRGRIRLGWTIQRAFATL